MPTPSNNKQHLLIAGAIGVGLLVIGLLTSLGNAPQPTLPGVAVSPSPSASPSASNNQQPATDSDIGKKDARGTAIVVDTPDDPACRAATYQVTKAVFEVCLVDGMTFVQVSNAIGYQGTLLSQSGSVEVMRWQAGADNERVIIGTFRDGKLVSKTQSGLN